MKEIVKYAAIIILGYLAYYHKQLNSTVIMDCMYFASEYLMITLLFAYLAIINIFKERVFFGVLSGYFGLKLIYNVLVYIPTMYVKLGFKNSEFWGWVFTLIIIIILILIQVVYVKKR